MISTICQSANCVETLESEYTQLIQIWVRKRLYPLPGFEPTNSVEPSRCATNWAIQAWCGFVLGFVWSLRKVLNLSATNKGKKKKKVSMFGKEEKILVPLKVKKTSNIFCWSKASQKMKNGKLSILLVISLFSCI